jgi:hypothetical protein
MMVHEMSAILVVRTTPQPGRACSSAAPPRISIAHAS